MLTVLMMYIYIKQNIIFVYINQVNIDIAFLIFWIFIFVSYLLLVL